jgi:hypothetical protein
MAKTFARVGSSDIICPKCVLSLVSIVFISIYLATGADN